MGQYDKTYPIPVWDPKRRIGEDNPSYAHNKKQEDNFVLDGWITEYANYPFKQYPAMMYDKNGGTIRVEDEDEAARRAAQGYSRTPIAKKDAPTHPAGAPAIAADGRVDALEEQVQSLTDAVDVLNEEARKTQATLQDILAAVTKPSRRSTGDKTAESAA